MSENQAPYIKTEPIKVEVDSSVLVEKIKEAMGDIRNNLQPKHTVFVAEEPNHQELRKWIAELVFNSQTVIWGDNAEIIDACKLIEGYILGNDNARL
jgi:hypothetical protein